MNTGLTECVFILDRSGSMGGLESDTIGGFNSLLAKQQTEPGECRITTVLFDNYYEVLHDRIDLKAVKPLTEEEYFVRGSTALLDAIGSTINKIASVQKHTAPEYRAEKVLFVITTDGMENSSREFSHKKVKAMIERQKRKYGWEFLFLGADIDAVDVANSIGIAGSRAQNFHKDREGIALNYSVIGGAIASFRKAQRGAKLDDDWSADIEADYRRRGGKRSQATR